MSRFFLVLDLILALGAVGICASRGIAARAGPAGRRAGLLVGGDDVQGGVLECAARAGAGVG